MINLLAQAAGHFPAWLLPLCMPIVTAIITDAQGFATARKADPAARFDFVLFGTRLIIGCCLGFLAAIGQGYAASPQ